MYLEATDPSPNTRRAVARLQSALGHMPLRFVRQAHVQRAANTLYPFAKNATKNRQAIVPAAAILHWAAESEFCQHFRFKKFPEQEPETRLPEPGDVELLLANTEGDKHDLILFLDCHGFRISEALKLDWRNVDLRARHLRLFVPKSGKWKTLIMAPQVFEMLANRRQSGPWVFPWRTKSGVYKWLRPLRKRLGIHYTPHMSRHAFGTKMRALGATSHDIKDLGSWTSARSTERYQHADNKHLQDLRSRYDSGVEIGQATKKDNISNG